MVLPRRLIVGITGATGIIYGVRLLELLRDAGIETHLVVSRAADMTRRHELDLSGAELRALATVHHPVTDVGAAIASGSFRTRGMIVAPCSVKSLSAIAYGLAEDLIGRAADVHLKEGRPLVLLFRETPVHVGHIKAMLAAAENGAIIFPPLPAFYNRPQTVDDVVNDTVSRVLARIGLDAPVKVWAGIRAALKGEE